MAAPPIVSAVSFRIEVTALTGPAAGASLRTMVPGDSGRKALRIRMGMPASWTGATVMGWRTLAPNQASSMTSRYERAGTRTASGTSFGSAVMTPSTSFQIHTSSAERRDDALLVGSDKPGDNRSESTVQQRRQGAWNGSPGDVQQGCGAAEGVVGHDPRLTAGQRPGRQACRTKGCGHDRGRAAFA